MCPGGPDRRVDEAGRPVPSPARLAAPVAEGEVGIDEAGRPSPARLAGPVAEAEAGSPDVRSKELPRGAPCFCGLLVVCSAVVGRVLIGVGVLAGNRFRMCWRLAAFVEQSVSNVSGVHSLCLHSGF